LNDLGNLSVVVRFVQVLELPLEIANLCILLPLSVLCALLCCPQLLLMLLQLSLVALALPLGIQPFLLAFVPFLLQFCSQASYLRMRLGALLLLCSGLCNNGAAAGQHYLRLSQLVPQTVQLCSSPCLRSSEALPGDAPLVLDPRQGLTLLLP